MNQTNLISCIEANTLLNSLRVSAANGSRDPRITVHGITFKLSVNGKRVNIVISNRNIGFCTDNRFISKEATQYERAIVASVLDDAQQAAEKEGAVTGRCAICRRQLTAELSVTRGIGPKCRKLFGWTL
jgi:hypothetical protein